ncbi:alcohol dehydrogenase [Lasiosphaeria miniovina]|uniref:Alcohol dehydrogenase n=1 Tax=Lasiosphaeria miniovina TaxID=1954250 RepID=A0AA40AJ55_9PEZI|nr:alcohol dehydrogenase [Lasiosphaeria miniovina]KAK0716774.1 alcohol dehydrogenase [Lasiosphaeria miniovina]
MADVQKNGTDTAVPSHHKAIVYDNPGQISTRIETVATPRPGVGEVLVRITHSGVCSSDHAVMTNRWASLPPTAAGQVGGHEGVGTIAAFGPGGGGDEQQHPGGTALKLGDRVGIKWVAAVCGTCLPCLSGRDALCHAVKISGFYTPGTFQQYVIAPANYVTPIPDDVPSDLAAPLLCGGVTVYAALKKSGAQPGEFVVVPGAGGGLGHLAVQIASRGMGFRVIGIDSGEKEAFVRSLGAEAFFDIAQYSRDKAGSDQLAAEVKAATGRGGLGAASVIVCTNSNAAYGQSLNFLAFGGSVVCVGLPEGDPVPIAGAVPGFLVSQELRIVGSAVGNRKDAIDTLDMAARGVVKTHFQLEPMSKLTDVFERMERMELQGRVVIDMSKE